MRLIKIILATLTLGIVAAAFFGVPYCAYATRIQAAPALIGLDFVMIAVLLVLSLLFGRVYCECLCPLGALQSFVHTIFHLKKNVRRVCSRLPETLAQRVVRYLVLVAFVAAIALGFGGIASLIEPYSVFGKAISGLPVGWVLLAVVLVLATVRSGRIWCNWICPIGTLFSLPARIAPFGNRIGRRCLHCRKCFVVNADDEGGEAFDEDEADEDEGDDPDRDGPDGMDEEEIEEYVDDEDEIDEDDVPRALSGGLRRRDVLRGVAAVAVAEKLTDGGYAPISLPGVPARSVPVLPPGAGSQVAFSRKCVGCQLCVANCPEKCLKPSVRLSTFGQPEMDFRHGHCRLGCTVCASVCPAGAIDRTLEPGERRNVHMGVASWHRDLCVRNTTGDACTACERKCPVNAIHFVEGELSVDAVVCIGCGACEHVCPARPMPAITVDGYERQRIVRPMDEGDLVAEMRAILAGGASVVIARNGRVTAQETGRGVEPLLKLYHEHMLGGGTLVFDRVIGRAAAAICIAGGATRVRAFMMSYEAERLLKSHGVACTADKMVEKILNRDLSDGCPLEKKVNGMDNPLQMVEALEAK